MLLFNGVTHSESETRGTALKPKTGIRITAEYKKVKRLLSDGAPVVFVTGKAGTGKSTLVHHLRNTIKGNCVIVAPTGVAAMNIQGATIHSFFRFPPRTLVAPDAREVAYSRPYKTLDLIIVDEVSMVRADVLDAIDRFMRLNGPCADLPFGGVQVLLVGDLHQLPPVVASTEDAQYFATEYESPFFFSSHVFAQAEVQGVELTRIFRQKDKRFIDILNSIRLGCPTSDLLDEMNTRVTPRVDSQRETVLSTTNLIANRINKRHLAALLSNAEMYVGALEGNFNITNNRLPSPMELLLKPEARVMFTRNDPDGRWVNGTRGVVRELSKKSVSVELHENGEMVDVDKTKWETYRYEFDEDEGIHIPVVTGSYEQLPLTHAWAITIHKSQGKTLSAARIDLGRRAFAPGQVYVALSRCRRLKDISLSRPITPRDVFCDARVKRFYGSMFGGSSE